jgi:hypothetical protein
LTALGLDLSHKRSVRLNGVLEVALKLLNPVVLLNQLVVCLLRERR